MNSRWAPPAPSSTAPRSDRAAALIDVFLKKRLGPATANRNSDGDGDGDGMDGPPPRREQEAGAAISNLEESYFRRTAPHAPSGDTKPRGVAVGSAAAGGSRGMDPTAKGDGSGCPKAAPLPAEGGGGGSAPASEAARRSTCEDEGELRPGSTAASAATNVAGEDSPNANANASQGGEGAPDPESLLASATAESRRMAEEMRREEEEFQSNLRKAMAESLKSPPVRHGHAAAANGVILLDDSDDENDVAPPADGRREDAQMEEALRLSAQEAERAARLRRVAPVDDGVVVVPPRHRTLTPGEFLSAVEDFAARQGGWERVEGGQMVKHGNANDMRRSRIAAGGGRNQTGAQYGRYGVDRMRRAFDVLRGREDVDVVVEETCAGTGVDGESADSDAEGKGDGGKGGRKRGREGGGRRLEGPAGADIKAFLDFGHGLGIQVLQAGWTLGVPSRGVEIMSDRHFIAESLKVDLIESLRGDPPDSSLVDLREADFSLAVVRDKKTGKRDEGMRSFLLFRDMPEDVQRGLVVFVNNAEEVFGARSNQRDGGATLDSYLARLFADMRPGGRMVTLTDVSCHLASGSAEWFRHDVFASGTNAVSWGSRSYDVHVLTKLSDEWLCRNPGCPSAIGSLPNVVVEENGDLRDVCVYCRPSTKRLTRNMSSKRRKGDE